MNTQKKNTPSPIYVVSGGRGIAANNVVQALLIQYPDNKIPVIIVSNLDNEDELFDTVYGKKIKSSGIYFAQNLSPIINALHDDHFHVDFRIR